MHRKYKLDSPGELEPKRVISSSLPLSVTLILGNHEIVHSSPPTTLSTARRDTDNQNVTGGSLSTEVVKQGQSVSSRFEAAGTTTRPREPSTPSTSLCRSINYHLIKYQGSRREVRGLERSGLLTLSHQEPELLIILTTVHVAASEDRKRDSFEQAIKGN
ncbi:hypothetical protein J6590_046622 [Homalodisca vitripennis]|nr:hypothetical protein J6590_046622 [Homalodisca vitripennis]